MTAPRPSAPWWGIPLALGILLADAILLPWIVLGLVVMAFFADPPLKRWLEECPDPFVRLLTVAAWPWLLWGMK